MPTPRSLVVTAIPLSAGGRFDHSRPTPGHPGAHVADKASNPREHLCTAADMHCVQVLVGEERGGQDTIRNPVRPICARLVITGTGA